MVVPILVALGNAILAVPMVRQLKRFRPKVHLTILARTAGMAEVYRRLDEVDELILIGGTSGVLGPLRQVRRRRPDVGLVPFPSNRWQYMVLLLATGVRRRILHGYPCGAVTALGFVPAERIDGVPGIHDVEQNLRLLERLGIEPDLSESPEFVLNEADHLRAGALLKDAGLPEGAHFIAVHPGSGKSVFGQAKRWPSRCWGELISKIQRRWGIPAVIVEGPDEPGLGDEISSHALPAIPLVVRTSRVGDAAAILVRSLFFVGCDSGVSHLAAAVGKKAVTIFGPADPDRVCPFGCRDLVVQPENMACVPCLRYPIHSTSPRVGCARPHCMEAIEVETVVAKIEPLLRQADAAADGSR